MPPSIQNSPNGSSRWSLMGPESNPRESCCSLGFGALGCLVGSEDVNHKP